MGEGVFKFNELYIGEVAGKYGMGNMILCSLSWIM